MRRAVLFLLFILSLSVLGQTSLPTPAFLGAEGHGLNPNKADDVQLYTIDPLRFYPNVKAVNMPSEEDTYDKHNAFGWGTCSDVSGTSYELNGGWHNEQPTYTVLYASGGDDMQAIMEAIEAFDIVVLDGSQGDFILSRDMSLKNIKHKSILGRNNARLCTQWYITPELRQALNDANVNQYSTSSGTGGNLSNGKWIDEARELHTRQTIIDFTGDETEAYRRAGIFSFDSSDENIIIRNLTFVGPGSVDVGGADLISNYGATNVWVDHCDFLDGLDGNLDSGYREGSDMFVTYSWNIFRYTDRSYSHSNSNLTTKAKGFQQYVTYAYNIWGEGCYSRLPRIEGSDVHILNNYYNCPNNSAGIAIASSSRDLVEGNYAVDGIKKPFSAGSTDAQVYWQARNNIGFGDYNNASNTDQSLEVPYPYVCFPTADVPSLLTGIEGAGPTLSFDDIVLPDGEPGTIQKAVFAVKEGDTFKSGQTVELEGITLTFGETGGPDFLAGQAQPLDDVFTAYTPGNDVNGNKPGGTFYVFAPKKGGTLTVAVKQNGGKALYVEEDGTALSSFNGITYNETKYDTFFFPVKAASTYKLYCTGSKLGFFGFAFKWINVVTGIQNLSEERNTTDTSIYNLAGQRLSKPQKGINIIGGRKVFVSH
jgi:pectate lyase